MPRPVAAERPARSVVSRPALTAYRAAVADIVAESRGHQDRDTLARTLRARLFWPELASVLSSLEGGVDGVAAALIDELRRYAPHPRSSARDLASFVRIYLLSQIENVWWRDIPAFETDHDVERSPELVDLEPLRCRRGLHFRYRIQTDALPRRAGDWLERRLFPDRRPHTAGLRFARARREVIALVNQLARELADAIPDSTPPIWVTSLVRSVEHQRRLRALGYSALVPSSHCVGYGVDVEMRWFSRFDREGVLADLLLEHHDAGRLNVIDEGQAWHVCVSPDQCEVLLQSDASPASRSVGGSGC